MNRSLSETWFERAQRHIPGGVNSPVRAFRSVGGHPVFLSRARGAYLYDVDGNRYIDYINSWGPMILGHAHPAVVEALQSRIPDSSSFGAPTELEVLMAEQILRMVPSLEMVRMVNSGTEACMSALRLARGYTGRNKVIKFIGNYHGHADSFLVSAGSGVATFDIQQVPGVTTATAQDTLSAAYNNLQEVRELLDAHPEQVAAIIVEPVAGNMGCIPAEEGFLQGLRELCDAHGTLLIFDEVMTGFRLAPGGAQELFGIRADLVTYGKIIGGGLPVGAFGGPARIMEHIAPCGKVYQAGTLSGNPLAMAAGLATLQQLESHPQYYSQLEERTKRLAEGLAAVVGKKGLVHQINSIGSMLSLHFAEYPIRDFQSASAASNERFKRFFHGMLDQGIYLPPSPFESWFLSIALTDEDIDSTLQAAEHAL